MDVNQNGHQPQYTKLADIVHEVYDPLEFIVEDILPEGHSLLSGRPKIGKTRLLHSLLLAIAEGDLALGHLRTLKRDVLLLALEDNHARLKRRTLSMRDPINPIPKNFDVATHWKRLDDGGLDDLEAWLELHPHGVIGIDTYVKIASRGNGKKTLYHEDYDSLTPLTELASRTRSTIISVMHNRKQGSENPWDEISGSTGLAGAVDGALIFRKDSRSDLWKLFFDGRDIVDKQEYGLSCDKSGVWKIEGVAWKVAQSRKIQEIYDLLAANPLGLTSKEVAEKLGKNISTVKNQIGKLRKEQKLDLRPGNKYVVSTQGLQPTPNDLDSTKRDLHVQQQQQ